MNTKRIKRVGVRTLIIAATLVAFAFTAGLVYAADPAEINKPENDNKEYEYGKDISLEANAMWEKPNGGSNSDPNTITFRIKGSDRVIFIKKQTKKPALNIFPQHVTATFNPKNEGMNEGDYTISVRHDLGDVDWEQSVSEENPFIPDASRPIKVWKDLTKAEVAIEGVTDKVYTGEPLTQEFVIKVDGKTLNPETDYDLSYSANTNAGTGTAKMTITGKGFYKNSVTANFSIRPADITKATVTGVAGAEYTGDAVTQTPGVFWNGRKLESSTDYDLSFENNTNFGTAGMTITGKGNFEGTIPVAFTIRKASIRNAEVSGLEDKTYSGSAIKQNLTLRYAGKTLAENTDYTLTYKNNINPGTATVTITGKGNFKDALVRTFQIKEKTPLSFTGGHATIMAPKNRDTFSVGSEIDVELNGEYTTPSYNGTTLTGQPNSLWLKITRDGTTVIYGRIAYTSTEQVRVYKLNADTKGVYTIQLCRDIVWEMNPPGSNNLAPRVIEEEDFVPTAQVKIYVGVTAPKDISSATVTGISDKAYTGNSITLSPTVKLGSTTLTNGTDYYCLYSNNLEVGEATLTIKGKGNYIGTITKTFNITAKQITEDMITLTPSFATYNSSLQKPVVTVNNGAVRLVEGTDYTLVNEGGIEPGEYDVTVTANDGKNYTGSATKKFTIGAWDEAAAALLNDKIAEVKAVQSQYLADDQKALQAAVNKAEQLFADLNTTTEQMNEALKNLNTLLTKADTNLAKYNAAVQAAQALPAASATQKAILAQKTDKDPSGSSFRILRLRSTKQGKTYNTLTWQKVSGATSYVIYASKCGNSNKIKKIATVKKNTYTHKKLKKKTYYKYVVVAVKSTVIGTRTVSISKMIHVSTKGSKYGNFKKVSVTKTVLAKAKKLKKGKSLKLGAKAVKASSKAKIHVKLRYQTSNKKVATVSSKGVVKGVGKGSCYVFVYAQNGVYKKIPVTVK